MSQAEQVVEGRRREHHKSRTRAALVDAALTLFSENGYDSTTTGDISAAAGVAPRTFFRYFESKEHVLFFGLQDYLGDFDSVFVGQPAESGDVEAMYDTFLALAPRLAAARPRYQLYRRAVESSATLRGRHLDYLRQLQAGIASGLASRRGLREADFDCRVVASLAVSLIEESIDEWMSSPDDVELADVFTVACDALRELVPAAGAGAVRRARRTRPWPRQRASSETRGGAAL